MVHETGQFSYAEAEHLADLWNAAYPAMRSIATGYVEGVRRSIKERVWEVDPKHPRAETLRELVPSEAKLTGRLKRAEELRRVLGQLDRGTHKLCTRSPGSFTVTGAYMAVRHLLNVSSLSTKGMGPVYRLAAALAEAEEELNAERIARYSKSGSGEEA